MKAGCATPTDGSTESTVYADVERMELNGVSARVYDCAGQVRMHARWDGMGCDKRWGWIEDGYMEDHGCGW